MRVRMAVSMPEKGGRPAISVAEVRRAPDAAGRRRWHFVVGRIERVITPTIEATRDRIRELAYPIADLEPCVYVDVGTPQGFALRRSLRDGWPEDPRLHRPHAYERTRFDSTMFATFLEAYADGRLSFLPSIGRETMKDVERALVLYRAEGVEKAGDELLSEDEALVHAIALSLMFPTHGATALPLDPPKEDDGQPVSS